MLDKAGIGGLTAKFLKFVTLKPPAVRVPRHDQRLSRASGPTYKGEATAEVTGAEELKGGHVDELS